MFRAQIEKKKQGQDGQTEPKPSSSYSRAFHLPYSPQRSKSRKTSSRGDKRKKTRGSRSHWLVRTSSNRDGSSPRTTEKASPRCHIQEQAASSSNGTHHLTQLAPLKGQLPWETPLSMELLGKCKQSD